MSSKNDYREWLKQDLTDLIGQLELSELQRHFLRSRWLDQVMWMEGRTGQAQARYYGLRLMTIIGGVMVPSLLSLHVAGGSASDAIRWTTFIISLLVAISAAVEGFFRYGERWRHYRRTVEALKVEGWQFFQLCGAYRQAKTHAEAYLDFAARVEEVIKQDVEQYATQVVQDKSAESKDAKAASAS